MANPNFPAFAKAIEANYNEMAKEELYIIRDVKTVWDVYLGSFPEGTNEIFKTNPEHDCNCCKQFVRKIGGVVIVKGGITKSVWDVEGLPEPYATVAKALRKYVESQPIEGIFRTKERQYGAEKTRSTDEEGELHVWNHFQGKITNRHFSPSPEAVVGEANAKFQVLNRGLSEITTQAIGAIKDLIKENNIYRGAEFKKSLDSFSKLKQEYDKANNKELFVWEHINSPSATLRNTLIGTLLVDLSEGVDIETAVNKYESRAAPQNYKRPKALVTKGMIKEAMKTIKELDLEAALNRRYATLEDISVNDVLFVDNSVQGRMKDGIEGLLLDAVEEKQPKGEPKKISIDDFMETIVPKASSLSLKVNKPNNLVSLTAPKEGDTGSLFSWGNDFAWSYINEVTDSVAERVKNAGGRVDNAIMRFSLSWYNTDDLDIHVFTPDKKHISFSNKQGLLDVDMNVRNPVRDAVENVSWMRKPIDGVYRIMVNNYTKRENIDYGFELHVVSEGVTRVFNFNDIVGKNMNSLDVSVKDGVIAGIKSLNPKLKEGEAQGQEIWGVKTGEFAKVSTLMKSPNHWEGYEQGNKHWFFMLDGCKNPEETRGIYNEFLKPALQKHRRVFEVLGSKVKCEPSEDQLSGIGFSSTKKDNAIVHATGEKMNGLYEIEFK